MIAWLVLCSVLAVAGLVVAVSEPPHRSHPAASGTAWTTLALRWGASAGVGASLVLVSGWVLPAVVVAGGTFWAIGRWQRREASVDLDRLDALAGWIENVRDVLMAGEQPVGAIQASVPACAPSLRPAVRRLAAGLGRQEPDEVFRRFADDVDDPLGDLVAAGLSIAVRRGARTVPVLTALAEQARQQVERRRLVEAERAPARREVQALVMIMSGLLLALLLLGRASYLDAYDAPSGQAFLAVALVAYVGLVLRVERLAAFPRPSRFIGQRVPGSGR